MTHLHHPTPELASVGLLGGMSPESSLVYYRRLIEMSRSALPAGVSPRIVLVNVNFAPYTAWLDGGRWDAIAAGLERELRVLARAGCDFAAIATNTMHKVLPEMDPGIEILPIVDAVAAACHERGIRSIGVTGTRFTLEDGFYTEALTRAGVTPILPPETDRAEIHRIIFEELIHGVVSNTSVSSFGGVAFGLLEAGADAILLGCTELAMLTRDVSWPAHIPVVDSTEAHLRAIFLRATATPRMPQRSKR